jgi:hypothetical protein
MKELMKRLYFEQNIQSKVFEKADAIKLKVFERKPKLKIVESETFDYESLNKNKDRVLKNSRPQVQKPYVNQTRQEQEKLRLFASSVDTRRQSTEPKTLLKRSREKTLQQSKEVNPDVKKLLHTTKNRQKLIPEISNLTDIIGDLSQVLVGARQTNRKDVKFQSLAFIDPKQWVVIKKLCLDTKQDEMTLEKKIEKFNLLGKLKDMKRSNMAKKINKIEIQKGVNVQLTNSELRELMMKEEAKYQEQIIHIQKVFRKKNPPIADQISQLREKKVLEKGLYFRRVVKSVPVYNNKILLG